MKDLNEEKRAEFDRELSRVASVDKPKIKVPSWWKGEEAASASTLEAARQMGFSIGMTV